MCTLDIDQRLSVYIASIDLATHQGNVIYIRNLFHNLNIADVNSIYFERNESDNSGHKAYIYMNKWYENVMVENLQKRIIDPNLDARLVYDDPNYWILLRNNDLSHSTEYKLEKLQTVVQEQATQIIHLETKNGALEKTLSDVDGLVQLHSASIEYLASKINSNGQQSKIENTTTNQSYIDSSCCGAASDAWTPSHPSVNQEPLSVLHWQNRLRMRANGLS